MYEDQTESVIRNRMLENVPSDLDKREGSFVQDGLSPAAIEFALAYIKLSEVLQLGFAQTAYGQYLDYRAAERGLTRKTATKAVGFVTVTGSNGTTIPVGSLFATAAGVQFQALTSGVISEGQTEINVEAVEPGASGNAEAGYINQIPVSIAGVTAVTNAYATSGGVDDESDEDLLNRLLERVRTPATSGNKAHYIQWAKDVAGVGDAKCFPIWNGPGSVKVVVIDSNKQPANNGIVLEVAGYIEEQKPIGATITVESATGLNINVSATIVLVSGYVLSDVQSAFEQAIIDHLKEIAFKYSYVSYAKIGALLFDTPGVADYSNLLVNAGAINVPIGDNQVAIKGTVALT